VLLQTEKFEVFNIDKLAHTVVPDSGADSVPDVTAAATNGAAHPPDPFSADTITLSILVSPVGRIATITVLSPDDCRHNTVPAGRVPSAAWSGALLPLEADEKIEALKHYFGITFDGEIITGGIETRRHDTPNYIKQFQYDLLQTLFSDRKDSSEVTTKG
jgi:hypothetical protein